MAAGEATILLHARIYGKKSEVSPEEKFIEHEWLVKSYARRLFQVLHVEYDDAFAWGSLGLWQAVHKEHPTWLAYARMRIDGAIRDAARLWHGRYRLEADRPVMVPWADHHERVEPVFKLEEPESYTKLHAALSELPPRDLAILRAYFVRGEKLVSIGVNLGLTEARVSQLKKRALARVRNELIKVE